MGCFKRMVAWVDKNWLKRLLVSKTQEQIREADEIEDIYKELMENDRAEDRDVAPLAAS